MDGGNYGDAPAGTGSHSQTKFVEPPIGSMNLGPPSQPVYPLYPPSYYHPLPAFGLSYNTAVPSTSSSYYYPHPVHAYSQPPVDYRSPPPSDPIHPFVDDNDHDDYYDDDSDDDDVSVCSIM
ncbi:hypothetical protein U1Q18_034284 [Sarracenia purpurea var. burkii]